ncbi:MAG: hypothetical protein HZC42_04125 [Candidatus Eisenbacteria bacterium]|nr:hypothetical protein [Candidatus Eisenbacteria bacterium]
MRSLRLLVPMLLAGCLFLTPAYGQGQPTPIDSTHYWTYHLLNPQFQPVQVQARDQFLSFYTPIYLDSLTRLVNWVYKNQSTVRDTFLHYTWWNIQNKLPVNRQVRVSNQFGDFPVTVERLEFLLAPAWKNPPATVSSPPLANHYLCYKAFGFPEPGLSYFLRDEWRNDVQLPHPMEYLCVPCWKEHGAQVFAPTDTVTHLALYPIMPQSDYFYPFVVDQFTAGNFLVQQRPLEYLLVPSTKFEEPTKIERSTWGRIKTLYR